MAEDYTIGGQGIRGYGTDVMYEGLRDCRVHVEVNIVMGRRAAHVEKHVLSLRTVDDGMEGSKKCHDL